METLLTIESEPIWSNIPGEEWRLKETKSGWVLTHRFVRRRGFCPIDPSVKIRPMKSVSVSPEFVQNVKDELGKITIPAFPMSEMGCDGGFITLAIGGYKGRAQYRWWNCPPAGWEPLNALARRIMAEFDRLDTEPEEDESV